MADAEARLGLFVLMVKDDAVVASRGLQVLGWDDDESVTLRLDGLLTTASGDLHAQLVSGQPFEGSVHSKSAGWLPYTLVGTPSGPDADEIAITGVQASAGDSRTRQLERQALYDQLTGLPNRALFRDRTHQAFTHSQRTGLPVAVLLFDLDHFKEINDTFGHHVGDELLRQVSTRLDGARRDTDTLARLGGDEFAAILPATGVEGAVVVADRFLAALAAPFALAGRNIDVPASVGIASAPLHGDDVDALLRCADIAMYAAKSSGAGRVVYARGLEQNERRLGLTTQELRLALQNGQIVVHYQPKVDLRSRRVCGAEALVRWTHPEKGVLVASEFLSAAERGGLLRELNQHVLSVALRQAAIWRSLGFELPVSVNIPAALLADPEVVTQVERTLATHELPGAAVVIEVVETFSLAGADQVWVNLRTLRQLGVGVSLNDFGLTASPAGNLADLPVTEVKLARAILRPHVAGGEGGAGATLHEAITAAHQLQLVAVAEGIEHEDDLATLTAAGCDQAQGFAIAAALPIAELIEFFQRSPWGFADARVLERRRSAAAMIDDLAGQAWDSAMSGGLGAWAPRLREQQDQIEIALLHGLHEGDVEYVLRVAGALPEFWQLIGQPTKYRDLLEKALGLPAAAGATRARALRSYSKACREAGDLETARQAAQAAVAIDRELGGHNLHIYLITLGTAAATAGDLDPAQAAYEEALQWAEAGGHIPQQAAALGDLGFIAVRRGDLERARPYFDRSIELARTCGDPMLLAVFLVDRAEIPLRQGDLAEAAALYAEALDELESHGFRNRVFIAVEGLAMVMSRAGQPAAALQLASAATSLREQLGLGRSRVAGEADLYAQIISEAAAALPKNVRSGATAVGGAMTGDELIASARSLSLSVTRSKR